MFICHILTFSILSQRTKTVYLPVCTRSLICSSDIVTKFPFSSFILAIDGKQFLSDDGAGVVVTQIIKRILIQFFLKLA